jgi:predicted tellurium resistance membrane protein TerC
MTYFDVAISLVALIVLEVVLGIDNLIMLSILTEKLPPPKRNKARRWGLTFAWMTRLCLLAGAVYLTKLKKPLLTIGTWSPSVHDLFLSLGGAFLIWKATDEIHNDVTHQLPTQPVTEKVYSAATFRWVILQVALLDMIFSLDTVLTAVGLTSHFWIMATAISVAILIMIYASVPVGDFIANNPTIKMLALSYLILIGTVLVAEGFSFHIPRGYLYFSMGFSLGVEALNVLRRKKSKVRE